MATWAPFVKARKLGKKNNLLRKSSDHIFTYYLGLKPGQKRKDFRYFGSIHKEGNIVYDVAHRICF